MFGRILIGGWIVFGGLIVIVLAFRQHFGTLPHMYILKPVLMVLVLASFVYGFLWLYRQGMKRAKPE